MADFNLTNLALKVLCPTNSIITDDKGLPSVMVRVPKFKISEVMDGGSDSTHPAFIVNGVEVPEIFISKYQNAVYDGRAYSLPLEDPRVNINFDTARQVCEAKGEGWHLMTNAEWAAIALWCRKHSIMPKGNNNYGKDATETEYQAIPTSYEGDGRTARVAAGSGPLSWSHNGTQGGIWDLNGNVWEWVGGYRTLEGEIQIIPNNNAAAQVEQGPASTLWRAIIPDGSLVAPGTAGALKWDYTADPGTVAGSKVFRLNTTLEFKQTVEAPNGDVAFQSLASAVGVTAPEIMKSLALYPADTGDHGNDRLYMRNIGERLACRGGGWFNGSNAGVFHLFGNYSRAHAYGNIGFRSAFVKL